MLRKDASSDSVFLSIAHSLDQSINQSISLNLKLSFGLFYNYYLLISYAIETEHEKVLKARKIEMKRNNT